MAVNTTTVLYAAESSSIPKVTQAIYNRTLLTRAEPLLVYQKFGKKIPLKQRNGKSMVFRRWLNLAENTTPLTEGVTPAGSTLTKEEVIGTLKQYGDYVEISDMLTFTNFDPIINEASDILGEQMGQSTDTLYANDLTAGTNAFTVLTATTYEDYSDRTHTAKAINKSGLDYVINVLDRANAKKFTGLNAPTEKTNTWAIAPSYWAVIHPDVTRDLYHSDSGLTLGEHFTPVEQYGSQAQVVPGEVGKYRSIRFIETTHAKIWAGTGSTTLTGMRSTGSNCDVYGCLFFARDAYGIVPLEKGSARTIIHRAGGPGDPLNQRNTVGWKHATCGAVILQDDWMVRLEATSHA